MKRGRNATDRLSAAARRLGRILRTRAGTGRTRPNEPEPTSEWEKRADDRLRAIERQLSNQNRLLLISIVAIIAETVYRVAFR